MADNVSETTFRDVEKAQTESHSSLSQPADVIKTDVEDKVIQKSESPTAQGLLVELERDEDPKNWSSWKKWIIIIIVSTGACCATCGSSMAGFPEAGISREFHVSKEVATLGISMFIGGVGIGPLLIGPLSEVYGRQPIYRVAFSLFFAFCWPVAFAPNIGTYLTFRFITGFCSSAFLSVSGGTVSDLFHREKTGVPMAVYTLSPFIGPMLGPLISGFINQHVDWRWTFHVLTIWVFVEVILIFALIPETSEPVLMKHKAQRLRRVTGNNQYYSTLDRRDISLAQAIVRSCYMPFKLLLLDRMNLLLDLWTALLLGILYLAFQAWPYIFVQNHGFNIQDTGLAFIGIGIGMALGCVGNIIIILHLQRKYRGTVIPPEALLLSGKIGAIVVPASLYFLAFTSYRHVHWILPIIASTGFGTGFLLCFTSVFTYLVSAYRPMAASAMSANAFVRSAFAAAFPLFAGQMYTKLGTDGASALLAGLTTLAAPLPFIFGKIGPRLRAKSPYATH